MREHSLADIWAKSPAFNAFRGTAWMQEPCSRKCARREIDFGGCRCQAFALTGDARATDPVCHLAPRHRGCRRAGGCAARRALRLPADVSSNDCVSRYLPASIVETVPDCRAYRSAGADPPLSHPLSDGSSEADQSVVRYPVQVIHGKGLSGQSRTDP